eukprot:3152138-Prorocentrum_lima.AAC.1
MADICSPTCLRALRRRRAVVACMGFPCQPFSKAGDQKGTEDGRADLYCLLPELHTLLQPWGWVLENVANFAHLEEGKYVHALQEAFQAMGMRLWSQTLELNEILPLRRKRWVAIAFPTGDYTPEQEMHIRALLTRTWNTRPPPVVMWRTPPTDIPND